MENPDLTFGSEDVNDIHHESPLASGAQEWLKDDHDDVEAALDMDIFKIADACLRTVKKPADKEIIEDDYSTYCSDTICQTARAVSPSSKV
jgi:hypothetical protein